MMPSPIVTASCLARRTKGKIAILGSAFCLREHPLTLAEEHAMLDNITGGRIISCFVRGIGAEYKDGVLTVRLPLREEAKPRQIKVDVAA